MQVFQDMMYRALFKSIVNVSFPISFTQSPILSSVITQFFNFVFFKCFGRKDMENIVYICHLLFEACKSFTANEHLPSGPG